MRGREMAGWLRVQVGADTPPDQFDHWVDRGLAHARSLPPKKPRDLPSM